MFEDWAGTRSLDRLCPYNTTHRIFLGFVTDINEVVNCVFNQSAEPAGNTAGRESLIAFVVRKPNPAFTDSGLLVLLRKKAQDAYVAEVIMKVSRTIGV